MAWFTALLSGPSSWGCPAPGGPVGAFLSQACCRGESEGMSPPRHPNPDTRRLLKESHLCNCQRWTRTVKEFKSTAHHSPGSSAFSMIIEKYHYFFIKTGNNSKESLRAGEAGPESGLSRRQRHRDAMLWTCPCGRRPALPPAPTPGPRPAARSSAGLPHGPCAHGCPARAQMAAFVTAL